ncbi:MAG: cytochrome c biogenesis protein ResB, partial [Nitrospirae bacterium]|nr:cytochrome c biogenesis protein ResB [Nitrospirota bacterium]
SASRLALGLGIEKIEPAKKDFSYMPKMWLTSFNVKKPDDKGLDANVRVNKPFRTGGLTFYQMGYEQKIKLFVKKEMSMSIQNKKINEKNPPAPPLRAMALLKKGKLGEIIDVEARVPFEVKNVKGKFVLGSLKLGTLYKKDGTKEKITPQAAVYYMPEKKQSEKEDLGTLRLGGSLKAKDMVFEMKDYKEASALSYRNDPGVWLVGLACLFVFIGLFVRSLGAWYRVQYAVEDSKAYLLISTRGILADRERIIRKLKIS